MFVNPEREVGVGSNSVRHYIAITVSFGVEVLISIN